MILLTTPKLKFSKKVASRILGKTKRWIIQGAVLVPFTAAFPAQAITYVMKKLYPSLHISKVIFVCTRGGDRSYFLFDEDEVTKLGHWCINRPNYLAKMHKEWLVDNKKYYSVLESLAVNGIKNLEKDFKRFSEAYLRQWSAPLIQEYYSPASDEFIRKLIAKYGSSNKLQKSIEILTLPPKLSFLQQTELAITELAIKIAEKKLSKNLHQVRSHFPSIINQLKQIQNDFFWIHFDYRETKPNSISYFYQQAFNLAKITKIGKLKKQYNELKNYEILVKKRQRAEIVKSQLTREEIRILKSMGFVIHWQDERKRANLQGNYWCNLFLEQALKSKQYNWNELQHLIPSELISFLKSGKKVVSRSELKQRMDSCLYIVFPSGQQYMISGQQSKKIFKTIKQANHPGKVTELRGIVASIGKYRGRVRKIETPALEGKKMRAGEILVTYMTRPDFVPLMHKAGAIVTDEGGLTSHAAIVSRELKVPCVVGTRFAMRILKDGDRIEVDANKGVIRKI